MAQPQQELFIKKVALQWGSNTEGEKNHLTELLEEEVSLHGDGGRLHSPRVHCLRLSLPARAVPGRSHLRATLGRGLTDFIGFQLFSLCISVHLAAGPALTLDNIRRQKSRYPPSKRKRCAADTVAQILSSEKSQ